MANAQRISGTNNSIHNYELSTSVKTYQIKHGRKQRADIFIVAILCVGNEREYGLSKTSSSKNTTSRIQHSAASDITSWARLINRLPARESRWTSRHHNAEAAEHQVGCKVPARNAGTQRRSTQIFCEKTCVRKAILYCWSLANSNYSVVIDTRHVD